MPMTISVFVRFSEKDGRDSAPGVLTDDPAWHFCAKPGAPVVISRGVVLLSGAHRIRFAHDSSTHPNGWNTEEAEFAAQFKQA